MGIEKSPEIKQIEKQIEAKERELKSVKRRRYTPKVSAFGAITDDLVDDWGEGSDLTSGGSAWSVGAKMEISLYEGGNIGYETSRIEKEIESLILSKKDLENEISEGISASYSNVLKDYIRVATTKEGAIAANKNLELISDFYAKGTISISDLLDARTNSISADQIEIAAKYGYFKSLINLERSKGSYYLLSKPEDKKEEIEKLKVYIEENLGGE